MANPSCDRRKRRVRRGRACDRTRLHPEHRVDVGGERQRERGLVERVEPVPPQRTAQMSRERRDAVNGRPGIAVGACAEYFFAPPHEFVERQQARIGILRAVARSVAR